MHPKDTRRIKGKLWHKEDAGLSRVEAISLKKHLIKTEDKKSRMYKAKEGYEVWWAR